MMRRPVVFAFDSANHNIHRGLGHFAQRLADGRQRRVNHLSEHAIVNADDRNVIRDAQA